jgi:hypothetical protein
MSIQMTPQGQQAEAIVDWVFGDIASRAEDGMRRLDDLATAEPAGSQALREIQDAGTVVSRLLPSGPATISDQMGG